MIVSLWWRTVFLLLLAVEGSAAEFYRCAGDGGPPRFFPQESCQLLTDPTASIVPPSTPEPTPTPSPPPVLSPALPSVGPWTVTQLFVPNLNVAGYGWQAQAIINNRRVGIGALVEGGRVQAITRTFVVMAHPGGETVVPFGQKTVAKMTNRQAVVHTITPDALGSDLSHLLQRVAAGEELLIVQEGRPLARLLPVSKVVQ